MEVTEISVLLQKLSNAHGISGFESSVAKIIRDEVAPFVDEVTTDKMGNLIAVKKGDDFKIMLAAHMDEIGLMVQFVDDHGFIRFVGIGGWYNPVLVSQRVLLHGEKGVVRGVLGTKPPHVMSDEDRKKPVGFEDMFIDVGATSPEEVEALGISVGTPVTIDREFAQLSGTVVTGKAFDNRAGCAMLIGALREMETKHTIYAVFTVQEEVGLKGAKTSSFTLNPDVAIATDVTIPGDSPGIERRKAPVFMGKGPVVVAVSASGRGHIADPRVVSWLVKTGKKFDIPVQVEVGDGGNTDASAINFERGGIPSVPVSVPARYIHSPVEVVDLRDVQAGISLIAKAVATQPKLRS
ncbi:M42 family metallopeptidase [Methanorbis rubei]|uniref:Aminopeptidase YsdC n=1 Tax=Methanorbis rubei TaxID=3028300 RepID=A0AAE4MEN3_9EURY|nr:putative aminopeptidase YsdC [Methanocorpusculaceae archaeon Cs1]